MPTHRAEVGDADRVGELLRLAGASHVRTRRHGSNVIVESGPARDPLRHIRLRRDTVHLWCLEVADHRGRWERTPVRGLLDDVVAIVVRDFPWTLTPDGTDYPE